MVYHVFGTVIEKCFRFQSIYEWFVGNEGQKNEAAKLLNIAHPFQECNVIYKAKKL